jgi:ornithine cyclodeaminase/alanine dehydrogenase-like protein (mu-crystallin family)
MINLDASDVAAALPCDQLIETLDLAFRSDVQVPSRVHYEVPVPGGNNGILLLMPAWQPGIHLGVKIVTVFPDNARQGNPAVFGSYLLLSAETGSPIAFLDGTELTLRRTAAASALASTYLSRKDSCKLLMIGTGNLAPHLVKAHAIARPVTDVCIWGRRAEAANRLADRISESSLTVTVADNLEHAVRDADIISCATLASKPLVKGDWLMPGQHLDLVGNFKPDTAEADEQAMCRGDVYVDTRAGAFAEAGEIVQALESGAMTRSDIKGSLRELASGDVSGRHSAKDITVFKSVGTALEDLAAARLAIENHITRITNT